jgi:hypothetical protein
VAVLKANADTVKEVVEAYRQDRLEELTEGYAETADTALQNPTIKPKLDGRILHLA